MKTTMLAQAALYGLATASGPVYTGESQPTALASEISTNPGGRSWSATIVAHGGTVVLRLGAARVLQLPEPPDFHGTIRGVVITDHA